MKEKLLLKNCQAFVDGHIEKTNILISDGKIASLDNDVYGSDCRAIDCSEKIVLPGLVDTHVHMRYPGFTHKEDVRTGSQAAAAGGVTTILDMPNTFPQTLTLTDLDEKRREYSEKSIVNYGFHIGLSESNLDEIKEAENIASTKIFLNDSTGDMKVDDLEQLENAFEASRMVMVHAEGKTVETAVALAEKTGKKLHLAHISMASELEWLRENKSENISIEVTPHHLLLSKTDDPLLEVKPSLNTEADRSALWKALDWGLIDTIGSDHAPHLISEKESTTTYGIPGVETTLPLMLDAVNKDRLSLGRMVKICCDNPCKIFGIKNKGIIKVGYDADLVVVDMKKKKKVEKLYTKCGWSPYTGWELQGWPETTIVNGNIVYADEEVNTQSKGSEVCFE